MSGTQRLKAAREHALKLDLLSGLEVKVVHINDDDDENIQSSSDDSNSGVSDIENDNDDHGHNGQYADDDNSDSDSHDEDYAPPSFDPASDDDDNGDNVVDDVHEEKKLPKMKRVQFQNKDKNKWKVKKLKYGCLRPAGKNAIKNLKHEKVLAALIATKRFDVNGYA